MPGWRDIGTAPKDGTHFLIAQGEFVARAFYKPNPNYRATRPVTLQVMVRPQQYCAADGWLSPTHWRPLLELPQEPTP
jgi:hypothetical protein